MSKKIKICVFTGTRAEYGLLRPILQHLKDREDVVLQLLVSGSHLSSTCGCTENEILDDGFQDYETAEILLDGGGETSVCTAMGLGLIRYGDILKRLMPDVVVVLGDRFEALAFATAATIFRRPIAHIHGGEVTEGAMDDAFRHAITKMSHIHFTSTEIYRQRVIQMGEVEDRVFNVGALGVENIKQQTQISKEEVYLRLGIPIDKKYFLLTYHPVTLEPGSEIGSLQNLLSLRKCFPDYVWVFTGANADQGGSKINELLKDLAKTTPEKIKYFASLGSRYYIGAAKYADVVIGNSSSGIIEVPSLGTPVVNIGYRQRGRVSGESVISCDDDVSEIEGAINRALTPDFKICANLAVNPYEGRDTSYSVVEIILKFFDRNLILKKFVDIKQVT